MYEHLLLQKVQAASRVKRLTEKLFYAQEKRASRQLLRRHSFQTQMLVSGCTLPQKLR